MKMREGAVVDEGGIHDRLGRPSGVSVVLNYHVVRGESTNGWITVHQLSIHEPNRFEGTSNDFFSTLGGHLIDAHACAKQGLLQLVRDRAHGKTVRCVGWRPGTDPRIGWRKWPARRIEHRVDDSVALVIQVALAGCISINRLTGVDGARCRQLCPTFN